MLSINTWHCFYGGNTKLCRLYALRFVVKILWLIARSTNTRWTRHIRVCLVLSQYNTETTWVSGSWWDDLLTRGQHWSHSGESNHCQHTLASDPVYYPDWLTATVHVFLSSEDTRHQLQPTILTFISLSLINHTNMIYSSDGHKLKTELNKICDIK